MEVRSNKIRAHCWWVGKREEREAMEKRMRRKTKGRPLIQGKRGGQGAVNSNSRAATPALKGDLTEPQITERRQSLWV